MRSNPSEGVDIGRPLPQIARNEGPTDGPERTPTMRTAPARTITVGTPTPWGRADLVTQHEDGIVRVSTPSHGGFYVPGAALDKYGFTREETAFASRWSQGGGPYWWEEDCAAAIVLLRVPHTRHEGHNEDDLREYVASFLERAS